MATPLLVIGTVLRVLVGTVRVVPVIVVSVIVETGPVDTGLDSPLLTPDVDSL